MHNWFINFTKEAERDLENLNSLVKQRVIEKIEWLENNASLVFHKGLSRDFKNCYKLRIGDWRAVYTLDEKLSMIVIIQIEHRSKVYKKRA